MIKIYFIDDELRDLTILNWRNMVLDESNFPLPNLFFANGKNGFSKNAKLFLNLDFDNVLYILTNSLEFVKFATNKKRGSPKEIYYGLDYKGTKESWVLFKDLLEQKNVTSVHPEEFLYSYLLLDKVYKKD